MFFFKFKIYLNNVGVGGGLVTQQLPMQDVYVGGGGGGGWSGGVTLSNSAGGRGGCAISATKYSCYSYILLCLLLRGLGRPGWVRG